MWIRSQNRKVLKQCTSLSIVNIEFSEDCMIVDGFTKLGTYSSEEKAMKVLDMIQGCITGNKLTNNHYEIFRDCPASGLEFHGVFQMPKDEDVE